MRVVTNERKIERNKRIAQTLFFVSIIGMIGSIFLLNSIAESNPELATNIQCLSLGVLMVMVITSVRMTNIWVRQPHPWVAIREGLKGTDKDITLYNFVMPADHVLLTPYGNFAITTRFQDKPQKVTDDKWQTRLNPLSQFMTFFRQEQLGNPTKEAQLRAKQTEAFLQALLEDDSIIVQPLIVFTHPRAKVDMEGALSVPVVFASADYKKMSLKTYLKDIRNKTKEDVGLSEDQMDELDDVLLFVD